MIPLAPLLLQPIMLTCRKFVDVFLIIVVFTDPNVPIGTLSKSFQGNFLEAINLTTNGMYMIHT